MLQGKIAIVTGASRGIGAAIAVELAAQGATVVVNHRDSAAQAEAVVAQIIAAGGQAVAIQADVSLFTDAQRLIKETMDRFGRLDILVNNAGTTRDTLLMMMSEEAWDIGDADQSEERLQLQQGGPAPDDQAAQRAGSSTSPRCQVWPGRRARPTTRPPRRA